MNGASQTNQDLRVLILEDHDDMASLMMEMLRELGYVPTRAATVAEALEATVAQPFDIVIADYSLPDGSGVQAVGEIMEHRPVRAILLSGYDEATLRLPEQLFVGRLEKPVELDRLSDAIGAALSTAPYGGSA